MKEKNNGEGFRKICLSIYPTKEGFGFAVFETPREVIDWGVVNIAISPEGNKNQVRFSKFSDLVDFYQPELVITEELGSFNPRRSASGKKFIEQVEKHCRKEKLALYGVSQTSIESTFSAFGAKTKFERAKVICEWFPMLQPPPNKRKPWQSESYRTGAFSAITLILTYYYQEL